MPCPVQTPPRLSPTVQAVESPMIPVALTLSEMYEPLGMFTLRSASLSGHIAPTRRQSWTSVVAL